MAIHSPNLKVFISSTYIDLREYRHSAIDMLLRLKLEPIAMEYFGAKPSEPSRVCSDEITESDIFVGIYAYRYGTILEGSEKSITEQELELAQKLGKPCFCYMVNDDYPWLPKFIEDEPGKSKLHSLKTNIKNTLVIDTFTTTEDLGRKLASDLGKWITKNDHNILWSASVIHNLLRPDYDHFIGREDEKKEIHRLLSRDNRTWIVLIDGIGGVGKSALALEIAHYYLQNYSDIPTEERFDAIIWTSAKTKVLTSNGILPRSRADRTLEDIFNTIAITLNRPEITQSLPERQTELVIKALIQQRTLLVIDNLETISDNRVEAFLKELPPPTKAIVTTRHRIDLAYPIRLSGMPRGDAVELILQEGKKWGVLLSDTDIQKLCDRTGSLPLAIVWSIAQIGFGRNKESVIARLGGPESDVARFCFEEAIQLIKNKDSYQLLMALSLFATSALREVWGQVAGLGEDIFGLDEGIVELTRLSLVNLNNERFSILPLTKTFVIGELNKAPIFQIEIKKRFLGFYNVFWEKHKDADVGGLLREEYRTARLEMENTLSFIDDLCNQSDWRTAGKLIHTMANFFFLTGLWTEKIQTIELISDIAIRDTPLSKDDRLLLCHLWLDIASLLCWSESHSYAEKWLILAKEVIDDIDSKSPKLRYLAYKAAIEQQSDKFDAAKGTLEERLELAKQANDSHKIFSTEYLLASLDLVRGNLQEAEQAFRVIILKAKTDYPRAVPYVRVFLANIASARGELSVAEQGYVQAEIELSELYGDLDVRGIALIQAGKAQIEAKRKNNSVALDLAKNAFTGFSQLGLAREKKEMEVLIEKLIIK